AGATFGIPVTGTMAHSFIQAHDDEVEAMERFARVYPETVLLVDTYDPLTGIRRVIELAKRLGERCRLRGIRLDSGDLTTLAREARRQLDQAGLSVLKIFASGNLDEYRITELLADGAPIDAFGVGTSMGTSADAPSLDTAYKLAELDGLGRLKLTANKDTWPGVKQVWRRFAEDGTAAEDTLGLAEEELPGTPLLEPMMRGGHRVGVGLEPLEAARQRAAEGLRRLPEALRRLDAGESGYPVRISDRLREERRRVVERLRRAHTLGGCPPG
ncbi:MAG TPA: nicotinate phosphoribosyltransferase, partial [Acidobacteria bacterium]|nr:nicotinate phosphoribosyltransferase [Acidobacteriota bacterium]